MPDDVDYVRDFANFFVNLSSSWLMVHRPRRREGAPTRVRRSSPGACLVIEVGSHRSPLDIPLRARRQICLAERSEWALSSTVADAKMAVENPLGIA